MKALADRSEDLSLRQGVKARGFAADVEEAIDPSAVRKYKGSRESVIEEVRMVKVGPRVASLANEWVGMEPGATLKLAGWGLRVVEVSGPELVRSRLPFAFEDFGAERVAEFRRRFQLEAVVSRGRTELEGLMLLRDWVADRVPFGQPPQDADVDPFHILERAAQGAKHNCTYLSVVYLAALVSLGHVARKLSTVGHGTVEVWSNELAKWVVLDPSRRNCYTLGGQILNAQEVRQQHFADGGVSMEVVFGLGDRRERVTLEKREDGHLKYRQEAFAWTAYHDRNNFLTRLVDFGKDRFYILRDRHNGDQAWMTQPAKPSEKPRIDERYRLATVTERLADIYWSANVTRVRLALRSARSLAVQLETITPNFDSFLRGDDGAWKPVRAEFTGKVREGVNRLAVRSRNQAGVLGPVGSVTVQRERCPAE
jgi:hypothetical protein